MAKHKKHVPANMAPLVREPVDYVFPEERYVSREERYAAQKAYQDMFDEFVQSRNINFDDDYWSDEDNAAWGCEISRFQKDNAAWGCEISRFKKEHPGYLK